MANKIQTLVYSVTDTGPVSNGIAPGQIYSNLIDLTLGVGSTGDPTAPIDLLAVRHHSASATYSSGDHVVYNGVLYVASGNHGPSAFSTSNFIASSTQWTDVTNGINTSSNVGIDEASPQYPLDVNGDARVQGKLYHEGIDVTDTSADGDSTPNAFPDSSVSFSYTDDLPGTGNTVDSAITVKGGAGGYGVWQLASNSSSSATVDTEGLFFRAGRNTTWGEMREVATDDGSGNWGFGIDAPVTTLHVKGASGESAAVIDLNTPASGDDCLLLDNSTNDISTGSRFLRCEKGSTTLLGVRGDGRLSVGGDTYDEALHVAGNVKSTGAIYTSSSAGIIYTGSAAGDNLAQLGCQTGGSYITLYNDVKHWTMVSPTTNGSLYIQKSDTSDTWEANWQFKADGDTVFPGDFTAINIHAGGNVTAGGTCCSSDIRVKKDITQILNAEETLSQLNGYTFTWKETDLNDVGVIAQEVEQVLPELVTEHEGIKRVNYNGLVAVLIAGLKDATAKIEKLEKDVESLKSPPGPIDAEDDFGFVACAVDGYLGIGQQCSYFDLVSKQCTLDPITDGQTCSHQGEIVT